jgi:hypothetical protein
MSSPSNSLRIPVIAAVAAGAVVGIWLAGKDRLPEAAPIERIHVERAPEPPPPPVIPPEPVIPEPAAAPPPPEPEPAYIPEPEPEYVPEPEPVPPPDASTDPILTAPLVGEVREHAILMTIETSRRAIQRGDVNALQMVRKFLDQPQAEDLVDPSEIRAIDAALGCIQQSDGAFEGARQFVLEGNASTLREDVQMLCFPDGIPEPEPLPEGSEGEQGELPSEPEVVE